jgi:hypothetical protein
MNINHLPESMHQTLKARAHARRRSVASELTQTPRERLDQAAPRAILERRALAQQSRSGVDPARHVTEERTTWD